MSDTSPQRCFRQLNALMPKQLGELEDLNGYLDNLKSKIANGELGELNRLVADQPFAIDTIEKLEQQRADLLAQFGFEIGREGFLACIRWCDQNEALRSHYTQYEKRLKQLQQALLSNHLLVSKSRERIRQSLHLLTHQTPAEKSAIYSACGTAETASCKRSLAQA